MRICINTHSTHQGVQDAHSKGRPTGKGLGEVQLCVRVIIIILVQELNVGVVHCSRVSEIASYIHIQYNTCSLCRFYFMYI